MSEEEVVQILHASIESAKKKPFALKKDGVSTVSENMRLRMIDRLLKENRKREAAFQIDSLPAVDDDLQAVVSRARLLLKADRFYEASKLILAFIGDTAPSDPALINALAAAECGMGRPEAAAVVQGSLYDDRDATARCSAVISSVGDAVVSSVGAEMP